MEQEKKFDFTFDSFNKEPKKPIVKIPSKFKKFINMGVSTVLIAGVLGGIGYGVNTYVENYKAAQDKTISERESTFQGKIQSVKGLIDKEQATATKMFATNQIFIARYAQYPELVKLLQLNQNIANNMKNNSQLLNQVKANLSSDLKQMSILENASTRGEKVDAYLKGDTFKTFEKLSKSVTSNQFMYVGGLMNLNKAVSADLSLLETTKGEITTQVKERLKAKNFDLNKAQSEFSSQISKEKKKELAEYTAIKDELKDTENASQFSSGDLQTAQTQLDELELDTTKQITQDRQTVEKMIAEVSQAPQAAAPVAQNSASNNFASYLLMYHWMSAGSTASYGSGYQAGVTAANTSATHAAIIKNNPYSMTSTMNPVANTKFAQFRNQMNTKAMTARTTISTSRGFSGGGSRMSSGG